jgi:hypothetical protein
MDPGVPCLPDDRLRTCGKSISLLVDAPSTPAGEAEIVLLEDGEDDKVCAIVPCPLDRFVGSVTRCRRQVDGQQDARPARRSEFAHLLTVPATKRRATGHPA